MVQYESNRNLTINALAGSKHMLIGNHQVKSFNAPSKSSIQVNSVVRQDVKSMESSKIVAHGLAVLKQDTKGH